MTSEMLDRIDPVTDLLSIKRLGKLTMSLELARSDDRSLDRFKSARPLAWLTGSGFKVEERKDPRRVQQDLDSARLISQETGSRIKFHTSHKGSPKR
jgi:hypothetical protein